MTIGIIIIGTMSVALGVAILISGLAEESAEKAVLGFLATAVSIIIIATPIQNVYECTHNHNCSQQITYTYQCKLCDETVKQTEEPRIKLCDECIATIKEIESEEY